MLDISVDPTLITADLVDIPSVSGTEAAIADEVEHALRKLDHFTIERDADAVVAYTAQNRPTKVILAGHLDTVPIANNVPSHRQGDLLYGCGTSDMKSGLAVMLHLAYAVATKSIEPPSDLTFIFYDHEEVEATKNGLGRLARHRPQLLRGDLAVLLEPTNGVVEAGCQGTLRAIVRATGQRAHSARGWLGSNAIHTAGEILDRLRHYQAREVQIDGCGYRESLNAVQIVGGVAANIIPDLCDVTVNFRFAPDRTEQQAAEHVREVCADFDVEITDSSPGALPGPTAPAVSQFITAVAKPVIGKYGWTDVARFASLGIPAVNFGPGDPNLAHTPTEYVNIRSITSCATALHAFLATKAG